MYERIVVSSSVVQGSLAVTDGNIFFLQHLFFFFLAHLVGFMVHGLFLILFLFPPPSMGIVYCIR